MSPALIALVAAGILVLHILDDILIVGLGVFLFRKLWARRARRALALVAA